MHHPIDENAIKQLFTEAHTAIAWQDKPVEEVLLRQVYDLAKMGPTSANCQPMRIVFCHTPEAKEKLKPCLDAGNVEKTMAAPVCAILGMDYAFYEELPRLFPHADAKSWFVGNDKKIRDTTFRNGSLQGAYFILAARALGLDCGPMSGFDEAKVNEAFFEGTTVKANFICNLGYKTPDGHYPRAPRPEFAEFCKVV